jgi:hypothetical protein
MIKSLLPFIFVLTLSIGQMAYGNEFNFNYKNLNTLGALICSQDSVVQDKETILAHKVNIDMRRVGPGGNDKIFEVSGSCDISYNKNSDIVTSFGDEFSIEIELSNLNSVTGKLGIKDIELQFNDRELTGMKITDSLMMSSKTFDLTGSHWAISDRIFNLKNKKLLSVNLSRSTAAVEKNNSLEFYTNGQSRFYNIWTYESFGCSHKSKAITQKKCAEILKK